MARARCDESGGRAEWRQSGARRAGRPASFAAPRGEFLRAYPARFAKAHGPLRPVVEQVLRGFLTCGLVEHGFARAWCETCRLSYLIPYSCRGRSFCPSCEKKRSILWAEWLREEVLEPVPHRHVVVGEAVGSSLVGGP